MHLLYDPARRGASKSIIPDTVVRQAGEAVSSGYNEIVLTGIHLGTYGLDLKPKVKLSELIKTILKQTTIMIIRHLEQKKRAYNAWQCLIAGKKLYI